MSLSSVVRQKSGRHLIPGDRMVLTDPSGRPHWSGQITHFSETNPWFPGLKAGTRIAWVGHCCLGPVHPNRKYEMTRPEPVFSVARPSLVKAA